MRLRNSGQAWSAWTSYTPSRYWTLPAGDGQKTVAAEFRNSVGSCTASATILLDETPPTCASDAPAGWRREALTVTLTGSDEGSGVARTEYRLDGDAWTSGDSVEVNGEGIHELRYRAVDNAGNLGETESCQVRIDATAPQLNLSGADDTWQNWPAWLLFSASDALSGVESIEYSTDGGDSWTDGNALVVSGEGESEALYRASDHAGNRSAAETALVRIDRRAPTTTANRATVRYRGTVALRYRISDALPGSGQAVARLEIRKGAKIVKRIPLGRVAANKALSYRFKATLKRGSYTWCVQATDLAGNRASRVKAEKLTIK